MKSTTSPRSNDYLTHTPYAQLTTHMRAIEKHAAVIVPAYQPDGRLPALLKELLNDGRLSPVIVVNDGSSAASSGIFAAVHDLEGVVLLQHPRNLGKGAALKTAFRYCLESLPACIGAVTADCDGQHTAKDILAVAETLTDNADQLILGVRNFNAPGIPARSRVGNRLSVLAFRLAGVRVTDTQTGLRGIPRSLMTRLLDSPYDRYEFETSMLIEAARNGVRFHELPIQTLYLERNKGSHFSPLRDSFRIYRVLLSNTAAQMRRFVVSSLASAALDLSLFSLLFHILLPALDVPRLFWATLIARLVSATFNYLMNRRYVFQRRGAWELKSLFEYAGLCLLLAGLSYISMRGLLSLVPNVPATLLKTCVDLALFVASFAIQKCVVFHAARLPCPKCGTRDAGSRNS